jgi:hypothetical protein
MRALAFLTVLSSVLAIAGAAALAREPDLPKVICLSPSSPVESPHGFYAFKPRACDLHARGRPGADAFMVQMRRVHWKSWGSRSALGSGRSLANMVGPVPTTVRLRAPRSFCGELIFTVAEFKGRSGHFGNPMQLDRRPSADSC